MAFFARDTKVYKIGKFHWRTFSTFYYVLQPNFIIKLHLGCSFQLQVINIPISKVCLIGEWPIVHGLVRNHSLRVVIEGVASEWSRVTTGVPQGTIVALMLFLVFIDDLSEVIPTTTSARLFADDTKL